MIDILKKLYSLIPQEELTKKFPKIDNISESGLDKSTKIIYSHTPEGKTYLELINKNNVIAKIEYKSLIYPGVCRIIVFQKDINGQYSFNKALAEEILKI